MDWKEIGRLKQKELQDKIPADWKIPKPPDDQLNVIDYGLSYLSKEELEIANGSAVQALNNIRQGKWTSLQVTRAMCHAAAIAHQTTNCLTAIMFDQALSRAKELDDLFKAQNGKDLAPLHGLPVSIKDCFQVEGEDASIGYIALANQPAKKEDESVVTTRLRSAGAVLYCKTNIPMAMSAGESYNNVYGETLNPYNTLCTPGGSSGGEGALVAARGSLLGVGTDIAGSVRIPAAFCNLYTLKPSFGRFPTYGSKPSMAGQEAIFSNNGPMARTLEDVKLYAEWMVGSEPWLEDPRVIPIPWRKINLPTKLSLAVVRGDHMNTLLPPVKRGLEMAVDQLRKAGHEIIEFDFEDAHRQAIDVASLLFGANGAATMRRLIAESGEPIPKEYEAYLKKGVDLPTSKVWEINVQRNKFQKQFLDWWVATTSKTKSGRQIDGIISAVNPFPACLRHNYHSTAYTAIFNLLDYPAATFPVTFTSLDDKKDPEYKPINAADEVTWNLCKYDWCHSLD